MIPLWIAAGVLDVQEHVPQMRFGHETLLLPEDFSDDGECSTGIWPEGMVHRHELNLIKKSDVDGEAALRYPVLLDDYENRNAFVYGQRGFTNSGAYFPEPNGYTFKVWPKITGDFILSILWDGKKHEFDDEEDTPFTMQMAEVVADYVKARIKRTVDNDLQQYASFMRSYTDGRRKLFVSSVEKVNQG